MKKKALKRQREVVIQVSDATVRFNMASERIDNLKEYFVKLMKRQLMFQEFLALQNVNFTVRRGESWGIIGTNGSGKSTLLKLICGILKPYRGEVKISGSIAPLIELGAGFDGDLTAKENIFLNGAVLGYNRQYMQEHFDEIVDFAELHDFLDMPIKNYSSGMAARLGFSIATVVRPDSRRGIGCRGLFLSAEMRTPDEGNARGRNNAFVCVALDRIRPGNLHQRLMAP